ncbi:hypothetical protein GCM10007071_29350 [Marinobacter zhanjiangensis]|uniref:Uncharacterized protein n=1 Tax=Marinobacter zhanjiangensis TaxID=578215 RepID=A0ABQ3B667_9GAMM|nr:hypothetical protein GCM10007071_29350 [Marinobacter zhanjiangensis]
MTVNDINLPLVHLTPNRPDQLKIKAGPTVQSEDLYAFSRNLFADCANLAINAENLIFITVSWKVRH